jgi:hypothetical protein
VGLQQLLINNTEEYDGTSWTAGGNLGLQLGVKLGGCGTQTVGLAFGGNTTAPAIANATEEYDGTSHGQLVEI